LICGDNTDADVGISLEHIERSTDATAGPVSFVAKPLTFSGGLLSSFFFTLPFVAFSFVFAPFPIAAHLSCEGNYKAGA
jgi:hypothetical protein